MIFGPLLIVLLWHTFTRRHQKGITSTRVTHFIHTISIRSILPALLLCPIGQPITGLPHLRIPICMAKGMAKVAKARVKVKAKAKARGMEKAKAASIQGKARAIALGWIHILSPAQKTWLTVLVPVTHLKLMARLLAIQRPNLSLGRTYPAPI